MTDVDKKGLEEFIVSGRSGRRNALPDILDDNHAATATSELPYEMSKLQCSDKESEDEKSDTASAATPEDNEKKEDSPKKKEKSTKKDDEKPS